MGKPPLIRGLNMKESPVFMKRSSGLYHSLRQRLKGLHEKEKIKCPDVGFDLKAFRQKMLCSVNQMCPYCEDTKLTPAKISADHIIPISRGGSSYELGNLLFCCLSCNHAKHELTAQEFVKLMAVINTFEKEPRNKTLGRLKSGASIGRLRFLKGRGSIK